jgi:V/A-type H+-transporting ATPase subunit A
METARTLREDYLHQNAFHEVDTYSSLNKQYLMLKAILMFDESARNLLKQGISLKKIIDEPIRERISKAKYVPEDDIGKVEAIVAELKQKTAGGVEG